MPQVSPAGRLSVAKFVSSCLGFLKLLDGFLHCRNGQLNRASSGGVEKGVDTDVHVTERKAWKTTVVMHRSSPD
jgi:hypothetical protein